MLLLPAGLAVAPAAAQDVYQPVQAAPAVAPDALAQARAAAIRHDPAEALSRYLRVLATQPDDVAALTGAGQAALAVGDVNAAAGFFGRADARDPRNGTVKVGLAQTLLQQGNPRGALRLFHDAADLGVPVASFAADRGLAYDLRGDQRRAQADYQLVLRAGPNDEVTRRLAISQAIAGDRVSALATLDPLLRRQDVPAWRARAFVFALTGDSADALTAAALVLPRDQVDALAPYLPRLAGLRAGDKAAAIHLGRFPGEAAASPGGAPVTVASTVRRPPVTVAAASAVRPPLPPDGSAMPGLDPFAPVPTVPAGSVEEDQRARERALTQVLAEARARAGRERLLALPRGRTPTSPVGAAPDKPVQLADAEPARTVAPAKDAATPPAQTRAERLAEEKKRRADAAAKQKAADEKAAAKAKEAEEKAAAAEERKAKLHDPARHWVQVAGGANKADLGRAWSDLKDKWPKQLAGRSPWTTHYRFTNRLLIGPFASSDAAQDWVSDRRKEGFATFRVETNAGDPVERIKGD